MRMKTTLENDKRKDTYPFQKSAKWTLIKLRRGMIRLDTLETCRVGVAWDSKARNE